MKKSIDIHLVKIINLLNRMNFKTVYSCSGHGNKNFICSIGYIKFRSLKDSIKVFRIIKDSRMKNRLSLFENQILFDSRGLTDSQIKRFWDEVYLKLKEYNEKKS